MKEIDDSHRLVTPGGVIFETFDSGKLEDLDCTSLIEKPLDLFPVVTVLKALKRNNPVFPVFSVFKFYIDLKKEAVESYKRELEKESRIKCVTLEEVEEARAPAKRKRRSKEGTSKRGRKSKAALKNEKQLEEEGKDTESTPPLPVWQERIPATWTQVYAPKKSSHIIGNKGMFMF